MTQKIKSFITFALSILVLFSTMGASAQQNNDRRFVNVWFDKAPEGGTVVVKQGSRILRDGDMVRNGSTITIQASVAVRDYSLAVLRVGEKHYVNHPVQSVSVKYRVEGETFIKAIFTVIQENAKSRVNIQSTQGGIMGVSVGDRKIFSGQEVPVGTILRIGAQSAKSYLLTAIKVQGGQSLLDVPYTNEPVEVFYQVQDRSTSVNVLFEHYNSIPQKTVPLCINTYGDGGRLYVFLGDKQVHNNDQVPLKGILTLKTIPERHGWLTKLTVGRLGVVCEPMATPFTYRHEIGEAVIIAATFSTDPFSQEKGNQPRSNEGIEGANTAILSVLKDGREILIERAEPNVAVQLYNMRGEVVCQDRTNAEGYCKLVAEGVPAGAYLFNAGVVRQKVFVH